MDQRQAFVRDALSQRWTMVQLCARYGVSRRIGYKWLARFAEEGRRGLTDRSRRPHTSPTAIRVPIAELLCEFRRLHPDWGARTLLRCCGIAIPRSRTGPRRVPRPICWRGEGSCASGAGGAP